MALDIIQYSSGSFWEPPRAAKTLFVIVIKEMEKANKIFLCQIIETMSSLE